VICPKCNAETVSDSAEYCPNCGNSFLRRPRAELVPPLPTERVQPNSVLFGTASRRVNDVIPEANSTAEKPIEAQWTRIEKVSFRRALISRVSEHLAKPSARRSSDESAVDRAPSESAPPRDDHRPVVRVLVVNRAQAVSRDCAVCGDGFASTPAGERLLLANVKETVCYLLCATCGDQIMSRAQSEEAAKRYVWDWAIPLRTEATDKDLP
jgi:hypothetical protein